MRFCCTNSGDGSNVHLRLLGCSAFVTAWLFLSFTWLRHFCLGGPHQFQVQALQPCSGQSNRTSFIDSNMMGYQCYGPAEPTDAVILSIYEGLQPRQVGAIRNNRAAYAERHGYRQVQFDCGGKYSFLAAANKLGALQILRIQLPTRSNKRSLLEQDSFSFADAVIVNYDTSIGQLFQEYGPNKDILFSKDYNGDSIINAGSMLIRRSKWSIWFLQHLYNEHRVWQQGGQMGQEQGAINQFAEDHRYHFSQHTSIVPYEVFNNHRLRYEAGTFVVHHAGWGSGAERYDRIADELEDPAALWSEYTHDDTTRNNATRQFCTEAFQIDVPHDRISDRFMRRLSRGKGFLLLLSRLWVPSSRVGGVPNWPLIAAVGGEYLGDALCHKTWNMTISY